MKCGSVDKIILRVLSLLKGYHSACSFYHLEARGAENPGIREGAEAQGTNTSGF